MPQSNELHKGMPEESPESTVDRAVRKLIKSYPDLAPIDALADRSLFTQEEYLAWLHSLSKEEQRALEYDWYFRARPKQRTPLGKWKNWIVCAGRGYGKTRLAAEWVRQQVESGKCRRVALVGPSAGDIRKVMVEDIRTPSCSGLLQICPPWNTPTYAPSLRRLIWKNPGYKSCGAECALYSGEDPELLRGPAHDGAWVDEIMRMRQQDMVWDMLKMGLREGKNPQVVITTTPKPTELMQTLLRMPDTVFTFGYTFENQKNLSEEYIERLIADYLIRNADGTYGSTRLGGQELFATILGEVEGALWTRKMIDSNRLLPDEHGVFRLPSFHQIVVGVDPQTGGVQEKISLEDRLSMTSKAKNMTGIVVVGATKSSSGNPAHAYVLADYSDNMTPRDWGNAVIAAYEKHGASVIVVEGNQGGQMTKYVIESLNPSIGRRVKIVTATTRKHERAQPVVARCEQGRVHHVGVLPELESELLTYCPGDEDRKKSPNRLDAYVWAIRHLLVTEMRAGVGISIRRPI